MRCSPSTARASRRTTSARTIPSSPDRAPAASPPTCSTDRAADRFGLDLARSWWIGDRIRDVAAATAFGGRSLLVLTGAGREEATRPEARGFTTAPDLSAAVDVILNETLQP